MPITEKEVMLRPEQLIVLSKLKDSLQELTDTLETYKQYNVPENLIIEQELKIKQRKIDIEKATKDFEDANYEMLASTSRRRSGGAIVRKIDVADYVKSGLPAFGDRQDLTKSLELITAFSILIDAEVVDKAQKLIELDNLKIYDVMDCIRGIYGVVDNKRGWGDRDNKTKDFPNGRLTMLIETLKPDEVEFEVEEKSVDDKGEVTTFPKPDEVFTARMQAETEVQQEQVEKKNQQIKQLN